MFKLKRILLILTLFPSLIFLEKKAIYGACKDLYCKNSDKKYNLNFNKLKIRVKQDELIRIENNIYARLINKRVTGILEFKYFGINDLFSSLLEKDIDITEKNKKDLFYEIESDVQYSIDNVFYAEGDVQVKLENGILRANKIKFDKDLNVLTADGNVEFNRGPQYFIADFFEYNFLDKSGFVNNIYGVIDFSSFRSDFNFKNFEIKKEVCSSEENNILDLPSQIALLSSSNIRLKNKVSLDAFEFNLSSIRKWRFKSKKIILGDNKFNSKKIYFTNDPFNKAQFILKSNDFSAEVIDNQTQLESKSTFLIFDDKLTLPIGRRTIRDKDFNATWGIGYDAKDKDGLYIKREFPFVNSDERWHLDIKQYFLLQRALKGKSIAFREQDSSVFSDNISTDINYADYFSLGANFKGKIFDWSLDKKLDIKTFNSERFYDAFSADVNLVKTLYSKTFINRNKVKDNCSYLKDDSQEFNNLRVALGFYGTYDKNDIYTAYGNKLFTTYFYKDDDVNKKYELIFDIGEYQGKNKQNSELLNLKRYGIVSSFEDEYKILNLKSNSNALGKYKFTPKTVNQGIFIKAIVGSGYYKYSNDAYQSVISIGIGPKLVYGNLNKKLLDYTDISVIPKFKSKSGSSPFTFDDFGDNSIIDFDINQQIFGPIIFGYQGSLNINDANENYGKFSNKNFSLGVKRRAYTIKLSYTPQDKITFLGFDIFNFNYKNFSPKF